MKWPALLNVMLLAIGSLAAVVEHTFRLNWTRASPDGHSRPVIGVNGTWPPPTIHLTKGDRLVLHVYNDLPSQETSIHFHGLFQKDTNYMDGAGKVTQCPLPPGQKMTYDFVVNQAGTFWYHSHMTAQYPDGLRAPIIVHDPQFPYHYDQEMVLTVSDWYHDTSDHLLKSYLFSPQSNPKGASPVPNSILINDTLSSNITVAPDTTYLIHLVNIGAGSAQYFYIDGHKFDIVEVDGVYTERASAQCLYLHVGQRYSILLHTRPSSESNFAIVTAPDFRAFKGPQPQSLQQYQQANWLQYDPHGQSKFNGLSMVQAATEYDAIYYDDINLVPYDKHPLLSRPNVHVEITVTLGFQHGIRRVFINNVTYEPPDYPTLYRVIEAADPWDLSIHSNSSSYVVLNYGDVVQLVVYNDDGTSHPFHLHGHELQVVGRSPEFDRLTHFDASSAHFPQFPMRRDTVRVHPFGYMVARFRADNPGVWLFHCHMDWHFAQGLAMTFIEAPDRIQQLQIPPDHAELCSMSHPRSSISGGAVISIT